MRPSTVADVATAAPSGSGEYSHGMISDAASEMSKPLFGPGLSSVGPGDQFPSRAGKVAGLVECQTAGTGPGSPVAGSVRVVVRLDAGSVPLSVGHVVGPSSVAVTSARSSTD